MRTDANQISLRAIRRILDAGKPIEVNVHGTQVRCEVRRGGPEPWPDNGIAELDPKTDGPLPGALEVMCTWDGGSCALRVACQLAHDRDLALAVTVASNRQQVVWLRLPLFVRDSDDGSTEHVSANISLAKRRETLSSDAQRQLNEKLGVLFAASGLPMVTRSKVRLFDIDVPSGEIGSTADAAFRALLHCALLKLDFIDSGANAVARGRPLVDVAALTGVPKAVLSSVPPPTSDQTADEEVLRQRRYWAGGFQWGAESKLEEFTAANVWQVGWARDDVDPAAKTTWARFLEIASGDRFAIKGYGGQHDLVIHYVGEVERVDRERGRLSLRKLEISRYQGKAPRGNGAGNWFDALVPVTRRDVIRSIFKVSPPGSAAAGETPLNLILYGPPGTGKTYELQNELFPRFRRRSDAVSGDTPMPKSELFSDPLLSPATRTVNDYDLVTFHQAYSYEDFIEGIRPRVETGGPDSSSGLDYHLEDGLFKRAVSKAIKLTGFTGTIDDFCRLSHEEREKRLENAPHYAVFVDEINRGNVSRVLGELITLLENDKRLGAANELIVRLPYSRSLFGVPANLHVIGTMNTADRSVETLDSALRRRFEFREMPPKPDLLDFTIEGQIDPRRMLRTINRRLERLRDRDHAIGHAYLLPLAEDPTLAALKQVFGRSILPLLQEYFFGDWGKIGLVLGRDFVRRRSRDDTQLAEFDHDERDALQERSVYEVVSVDDLTNLSFRGIYEDAPGSS